MKRPNAAGTVLQALEPVAKKPAEIQQRALTGKRCGCGAWDAYVGQNGYKQATGAGFQQYVAATPSALKVSTVLVQLNSLLQQLDTLGLSHKEGPMLFQHNVLAGLPANGMQDGDLFAAVESGNVK